MNLAVVNEAVTEMNGVEHQFTEEEKKLCSPVRIQKRQQGRYDFSN